MIPAQRTGGHDAAPYPAGTLTAAIAGDTDAFAELWRAHHDQVFRFVYYRLPDHATAEDITSETFMRAFRKINNFGEIRGGGFQGWLITIARNLLADRHKSSRHRREITTGELFDANQFHHVDGPESTVIIRLEGAAVRQVVNRLIPEQRACIELRFLHGLTVTETADAMDKTEGAIKTLTYRATRTLGRLIAKDPALADARPR